MARTTIHINSAAAQRIFRELERLSALTMAVAIKGVYQRGSRSINVAQVAAFHEFGTSRMPARPFIRESQRSTNEVQAVLRTEVSSIINGNRRANTAARRVAKKMGELLIRSIDQSPNWAKPLAPFTIKKKGHAHPLIETGLLKRSIYWRVLKGNSVAEEGAALK